MYTYVYIYIYPNTPPPANGKCRGKRRKGGAAKLLCTREMEFSSVLPCFWSSLLFLLFFLFLNQSLVGWLASWLADLQPTIRQGAFHNNPPPAPQQLTARQGAAIWSNVWLGYFLGSWAGLD